MAELTLARLRELLEYDPEIGIFRWKSRRSPRAPAGQLAGTINNHGRRMIMVDQRLYQAHRLAWYYIHEKWPSTEIDHINCDPSDNRLRNLREASSAQNKWNRGAQRNNTAGFKGVSLHKRTGRFMAQIVHRKQYQFLGMYKTAEEAHAAYCAAAARLHGDFARTS